MNRKIREPLTEVQRKDLEKELEDLKQWEMGQRLKIEREARERGAWKERGLDSNQYLFSDVIAERNRRFRKLQEKYGFC